MFLEVARRWMWVFFRVEAEWRKCLVPFYPTLISSHMTHAKKTENKKGENLPTCFEVMFANSVAGFSLVRNTQGPALDDVLLGDLSYKLDAD